VLLLERDRQSREANSKRTLESDPTTNSDNLEERPTGCSLCGFPLVRSRVRKGDGKLDSDKRVTQTPTRRDASLSNGTSSENEEKRK
jgi:hypothetical protein